MKNIAISGATGMLGSMLFKVFKDKFNLILIARSKQKFEALFQAYGKSRYSKIVLFDFFNIYGDFIKKSANSTHPNFLRLVKKIGKIDAFINCAGIINRFSNQDPVRTFFINSALPHLLSNFYKEKLIHITTDCVFSGKQNKPYTELSVHDPTDLYGLSKSLGEPSAKSLVLRSSFVGPEISGFVSLFEWYKRGKQDTLGFTNHLWNGITTKQFARICIKLINNRYNFPFKGLFHIYSNTVTKYQMLLAFKKILNKKTKVIPTKVDSIDRRLSSCYKLSNQLDIPKFEQMLSDFY
ncbi:hypothetical protein A2954_04345 [Candidatus Roizmanbacteria bacterium RIFCSPLOWO2_01_FULL_37_12]|uniref:dTDP-4-dehydrorhamnose reductase n=1 Tax=Candidatus Roizmanbacteria bacterium RIFCSPLOWO2_01_FULL_37_12 TaxID=1802056 RepID=A0A1F7IFS2_9BACT|nr:MAG: hypothetical protein A3D76_06255 [Candidatus Roizmanbacteria bacterium RIFCSPHIGHO2_02_FULL_37_9b]OGK42214.1 MAG: hypothetical protein A2954_04345 [Candidatus Roizmanbacteria bacterium RIFCSPLOWO2_01_FULL_37_12]